MKLRKTVLVFIIILIQGLLAVSVGAAAAYAALGDAIPRGIFAGEVDIGGLDESRAAEKIEKYYNEILSQKNLDIAIDDVVKTSMKYSDYNVTVDGKATVDLISDSNSRGRLAAFIKVYFGRQKPVVTPLVKLNEQKMKLTLNEFSQAVQRQPADAMIYIEGGKVVKKAETNGFRLNVKNTIETIKRHISENPLQLLNLSTSDNYAFETVVPDNKLKDFEDIELVLAEYSTDVIHPEIIDSIQLAADAINGVILPAAGGDTAKGDTFSFIEWLKREDASFENDNEGYDQVASTLYAALLKAGIDKDSIERLPHKLAADYIEAGLDAWISGSDGDLKFQNTFSHKLAILAGIDGGQLTIRLAGNVKDKKNDIVLKVDVMQRFAPPVLNMENKDMSPGEKLLLSPGKEGLLVNVYRNQELISEDKYEAEKSIVQVGPKTDWSSNTDK